MATRSFLLTLGVGVVLGGGLSLLLPATSTDRNEVNHSTPSRCEQSSEMTGNTDTHSPAPKPSSSHEPPRAYAEKRFHGEEEEDEVSERDSAPETADRRWAPRTGFYGVGVSWDDIDPTPSTIMFREMGDEGRRFASNFQQSIYDPSEERSVSIDCFRDFHPPASAFVDQGTLVYDAEFILFVELIGKTAEVRRVETRTATHDFSEAEQCIHEGLLISSEFHESLFKEGKRIKVIWPVRLGLRKPER